VLRRVKPHIAQLEPYEPGKPTWELERELGIEGSIKLASNENPLGPSPRAVEAIRAAAETVHRYPDGGAWRLREALAKQLGIEREQLVFGCGCSEILELVAKAFLGPGDRMLFAWPSFAMYPIVCRGMGAEPIRVPLDSRQVHDLPAMARAVDDATRVVVVCNPNNPTGTSVGRAEFDTFVSGLPSDVVLLVDEAYGEYATRPDFPDALAWVARRPGTAILRTFSKIYGLAGMRVGYGIMDPELAGYLERARHPFNVNLLAEEGALAALGDSEHVERSRRVTREGIEFLTRELEGLGVRVWPTDANYLLAETGTGVCDRLLHQGVIVRPLAGFGMPGHVRITIGTRAENERLIEALRRIRNES
jgi:histidinol-phosphate aminotransferase